MSTTTSEGVWKPPYIAFRTLLHLIDRMADNGIPPRIDRSFLTGSEGAKTQVLAALKAFGLIDKDGNVQLSLTELVKRPDSRKAAFKALLEEHYPEPVRLGSINATQGQLQDAFKAFGISGDTMRKAVAFYLKAAEFAEVPVSPNFKTPSIQKADGTVSRRTKATKRTAPKTAVKQTAEQNQGGGGVTLPTLHPALAGVLGDLPPIGQGWTAEQKASFKVAFNTLLDYSIPIIEDEDEDEDVEDEDDAEDETDELLDED